MIPAANNEKAGGEANECFTSAFRWQAPRTSGLYRRVFAKEATTCGASRFLVTGTATVRY